MNQGQRLTRAKRKNATEMNKKDPKFKISHAEDALYDVFCFIFLSYNMVKQLHTDKSATASVILVYATVHMKCLFLL